MAIRIDLRDYPGWLADKVDAFPKAARNALNDTAFRLRKDLTTRSGQDMTFNRGGGSRKDKLNITFDKTTEEELEVIISTDRPWLGRQTQDGKIRPVRGIRYNGRKYLLIPHKDSRTANGKLRTSRKSDVMFVNRSRRTGELLMFIRAGNRNNIRPIGALVPEADYGNKYGWEDQSIETVEDFMSKRFAREIAFIMRKNARKR